MRTGSGKSLSVCSFFVSVFSIDSSISCCVSDLLVIGLFRLVVATFLVGSIRQPVGS